MASPITHTFRLSPDQGTPLDIVATSKYQRLLGRLIYLTNSRPDITFAVHNLSQFISTPPPPLINKQPLVSFITSKVLLVMVSSFHTKTLLHFVDLTTLTRPSALPPENRSLVIPFS